MKTKMYDFISDALFWLAVRVSRLSTAIHIAAWKAYERTPDFHDSLLGRWAAQRDHAYKEPAINEAGVIGPSPAVVAKKKRKKRRSGN